MKKALLKTALVLIVFLLTIVLLIPAHFVLELFWPRGVDRLLPGIIIMFSCIWAANRVTSVIFWNTHLADERWSLLNDRRRRRPG